MPKFYKQNKKRIDPRYFLNETFEEELTEDEPEDYDEDQPDGTWVSGDKTLGATDAELYGADAEDPNLPKGVNIARRQAKKAAKEKARQAKTGLSGAKTSLGKEKSELDKYYDKKIAQLEFNQAKISRAKEEVDAGERTDALQKFKETQISFDAFVDSAKALLKREKQAEESAIAAKLDAQLKALQASFSRDAAMDRKRKKYELEYAEDARRWMETIQNFEKAVKHIASTKIKPAGAALTDEHYETARRKMMPMLDKKLKVLEDVHTVYKQTTSSGTWVKAGLAKGKPKYTGGTAKPVPDEATQTRVHGRAHKAERDEEEIPFGQPKPPPKPW